MNLESGKTFSHYKILSGIGKGGLGKVHLAEETMLDGQVAIKFLKEFVKHLNLPESRKYAMKESLLFG